MPELKNSSPPATDKRNLQTGRIAFSRTGTSTMKRGINVVALVKDAERYIFLYDDESAPALMQTLGRFAGDPDLSFSWYDAAVLSQKVRRLTSETADEPATPSRLPRT
jgi:hypothetical protein